MRLIFDALIAHSRQAEKNGLWINFLPNTLQFAVLPDIHPAIHCCLVYYPIRPITLQLKSP